MSWEVSDSKRHDFVSIFKHQRHLQINVFGLCLQHRLGSELDWEFALRLTYIDFGEISWNIADSWSVSQPINHEKLPAQEKQNKICPPAASQF